jgi:aldose 1-epimerase
MATASPLVREIFGRLSDGSIVERVRLRGKDAFETSIITYGAAVQALHVPDRDGRPADIVLGHEELEPYVAHRRYFGATVGRYANRIAGAAFSLDGESHQLAVNNGRNGLHGGIEGFDRKLWKIKAIGEQPVPFVTLTLISPDGDEGYPGTLHAQLTYSLTGERELSLAFSATTDRPTVVNLTNHSFFNLAGVRTGGNVLDHVLTIAADSYLPVDAGAIPLAAPEPVAETPFDFRTARPIGERIRDAHEQLRLGRGYDHNFCLPGGRTDRPRFAARLEHPGSGRVMELLTDQPGLQFYSGNFLDGTALGKYGRLHRQSDALCLEPQSWPDTPNRSTFPTARLDPGQTYSHNSVYRFSAV